MKGNGADYVLGRVQLYSRGTSGGELGDTACFLPVCLAQAPASGGICLLPFPPMDSTLCRPEPGLLNGVSEPNAYKKALPPFCWNSRLVGRDYATALVVSAPNRFGPLSRG
jgi:hypothetical protein